MGLIRALASFCLISPVRSAVTRGKVLRVPAAGRRSANDLAKNMRRDGVDVRHYYMQTDNHIRYKLDDPDRAIDIIESLD